MKTEEFCMGAIIFHSIIFYYLFDYVKTYIFFSFLKRKIPLACKKIMHHFFHSIFSYGYKVVNYSQFYFLATFLLIAASAKIFIKPAEQ